MSTELERLSGSHGCDTVGVETFNAPSGKAIYAIWCRIDGATITSYKELQSFGLETEAEVSVSTGTKISTPMVLGELWTFDKPLSQVVCSVEGLTVYYVSR